MSRITLAWFDKTILIDGIFRRSFAKSLSLSLFLFFNITSEGMATCNNEIWEVTTRINSLIISAYSPSTFSLPPCFRPLFNSCHLHFQFPIGQRPAKFLLLARPHLPLNYQTFVANPIYPLTAGSLIIFSSSLPPILDFSPFMIM